MKKTIGCRYGLRSRCGLHRNMATVRGPIDRAIETAKNHRGGAIVDEKSGAVVADVPSALADRIIRVFELARLHGYEPESEVWPNGLLAFQRHGVKVRVYVTTMTVVTCLDHPRHGKTQLFRRDVDFRLFEEILRNPRTHTWHGYYVTTNEKNERSVP